MIVIIDYGVGNLGSIRNMLKRVGAQDVTVSSSPTEVAEAERLILPGVGSFDNAARRLRESGVLASLEERVLRAGTPILGICLGMQLFMDGSEEGVEPGLGWIPGRTVRFRESAGRSLRIPHMGWNTIDPVREDGLLAGMDPEAAYYFVHSYHVECAVPGDVLATTEHGYAFASVIRRGNIMGTQFHPEKSHRHGMQIFRNFLEAAC